LPLSFSRTAFRIVYVGTLWNLASVAPFVVAVQDLALRRPDLAGKLEIHFAGRRTAAQDEILAKLKSLPVRLVEHSYLDHKQAVALLRSADALLLLLSDLPGLERVVPAKIFEYMAARRPILAILPRGETWDLMRDSSLAYSFVPADTLGISNFLEQNIKGDSYGQNAHPNTSWDPMQYDRKTQARKLAQILDSLLERSARRRTMRSVHPCGLD
jgi:hypothetical protein